MATLAAGNYLDADEWAKVSFIRNLFSAAKQYRQRRVERWRRNYELVHNKIWTPGRDPWLPSPAASEIMPVVAALVGWMTDQRPMIFISPSTEPGGRFFPIASALSDDLEKTLQANWQNRDTEAEHEKMIWDGFVLGTGIMKTVWDCALEEGLGDAKSVRVDPFAFYPDPQASSLEDANYLIEATTMSLQELDRRYPGTAEMLKGGGFEENGALDGKPELYTVGRPAMANPGGLFGNAPRYGPPGGDPGRASAMNYDLGVTVYEAWIREHDLHAEKDGSIGVDDHWRLVVVAGNRVLMDEPAEALFGHGRHPYTRYVTSDQGEFWGISLVEHLAPLQISLNRLLAAVQHNAELVGNPVWLEDKRSGIARTKIVNRPGVRVEKNVGSEAGWQYPPPMSAEVMNLIQFYIGEMERVSGLSAIVRGATPKGRNAQGVLDAVQEAAFVRVRLALRNFERAIRESGNLAGSLICENYTQPRVIAITGQENATPLILRSRHFFMPTEDGQGMPLRFSMWVQAGASLPTSRQARAAEADMLYTLGGIDDEALLDAHDYPNRQTILQRKNQKMAVGIFQPPGARNRARTGG